MHYTIKNLMFLNLCHFNFFEAYNIVDNNETSNYLTYYIAFNASKYDPDSREQTVELIYSVSTYNKQVC